MISDYQVILHKPLGTCMYLTSDLLLLEWWVYANNRTQGVTNSKKLCVNSKMLCTGYKIFVNSSWISIRFHEISFSVHIMINNKVWVILVVGFFAYNFHCTTSFIGYHLFVTGILMYSSLMCWNIILHDFTGS